MVLNLSYYSSIIFNLASYYFQNYAGIWPHPYLIEVLPQNIKAVYRSNHKHKQSYRFPKSKHCKSL